jgi:arabinogalactan endo-1,4-beta-galactosidase
MKTIQGACTFLFVLFLSACQKKGTASPDIPPMLSDSSLIAKGADVSWLTQMEQSGYKFYNASGAPMDCMELLQSLGINAIRLRVWVNPDGGWNSVTDVLAKALRAKKLGLRILIDFHYSDSWADPGKQTKPAAWAAYDFPTLTDTVYSYTRSVLDTLKSNGIVPSWVQIGNETNDGMLWPDGKASLNMANFSALLNAGYKAVKEISDSIQVIVHISNGYNNGLFRWMFDGLKSNGTKWDIIGMSLYPSASNWQSYNDSCLANMEDMISRYNKPVMICEVGMPADQASICQSFLTDIIKKTKSITGHHGLGVFYWEPESYNNWQGYNMGAFDNTGKPSVAMNAFSN